MKNTLKLISILSLISCSSIVHTKFEFNTKQCEEDLKNPFDKKDTSFKKTCQVLKEFNELSFKLSTEDFDDIESLDEKREIIVTQANIISNALFYLQIKNFLDLKVFL